MADAFVHVEGNEEPLAIRVNGQNPSFVLDIDGVSNTAMALPDPLALDLLRIACVIFAADGSVRRGGVVRPGMGATWRRAMHFDIGVSLPEIWAAPEVQQALTEAVRFLTDDQVSFKFRADDTAHRLQDVLRFNGTAPAGEFEQVILFSGGLDSFAGALETLATSQRRVVLVSHRSAQKTLSHQLRLGKWLNERFPGRVLHLCVNAHRVESEAIETTQRSRSFLFAALGQVVARMFGCGELTFFENGIVSHNLPFSPQVAGTMATRTTHPLALHLIGQLHVASRKVAR